MSTPRLSDLRRRDFLHFAGSTAALLALAASPVAALAQSQGGGAPLKIGAIGAGREGGSLGTLFAKAGHPVMFSSRHPEQLKERVDSAGPNACAPSMQSVPESWPGSPTERAHRLASRSPATTRTRSPSPSGSSSRSASSR